MNVIVHSGLAQKALQFYTVLGINTLIYGDKIGVFGSI